MKCSHCGEEIKFAHYFTESINVFHRFKHKCPKCHNEYKVKIYFWFWFILWVMLLKIYKYWMQNTYFVFMTTYERAVISIIALFVLYFVIILEQIVYYLHNKQHMD